MSNQAIDGNLVIIGGAEDKTKDCIILKKVIELSHGSSARVAIITAATELSHSVGDEYMYVFNKLGVNECYAIHINTREDANHAHNINLIRQATCIYFTGGDQLRITSLLGGTKTEEVLLDAFHHGAVIAGTSAGASIMSNTMIISGEDDNAPKKCTLKMAPGLGLLKKVIIDQHFAQRGRIGRLLAAIAQNPLMLGIGIDEDTALIVKSNADCYVIGSHTVTVLDAMSSIYTNVSELKPEEILALTNVTLHLLPSGYGFNLIKRKPIIL